MSDRTEKNENNAFLKLVKGKNHIFNGIKADTEHLRIDNKAQNLLDEFKSLTNEQIKAKIEDVGEPELYTLFDLKQLFIYEGECPEYGQVDYLYKYILHITYIEFVDMKGCEYDYFEMIKKNIGCKESLAHFKENYLYLSQSESDSYKIMKCLDWTDVDHYYSPLYLEVVRRNKFKKFVVPSMEIEAESEEEAKQIAASRLVVTSV